MKIGLGYFSSIFNCAQNLVKNQILILAIAANNLLTKKTNFRLLLRLSKILFSALLKFHKKLLYFFFYFAKPIDWNASFNIYSCSIIGPWWRSRVQILPFTNNNIHKQKVTKRKVVEFFKLKCDFTIFSNFHSTKPL